VQPPRAPVGPVLRRNFAAEHGRPTSSVRSLRRRADCAEWRSFRPGGVRGGCCLWGPEPRSRARG